MKVAVVSPYDLDAWGGVQAQVAGLVTWMQARGIEAWAVAPGSGGPDGTRHLGGSTTVRGNRSRAPIALRPGTARRMRAALAGADVVHVHEPFMPLAGWAALRVPAAPRIGTFHADAPPWVRAAYRSARPLLRRWVSRLSAVTAVSPVAAAAVAGVVEPVIIPNAVDVDAFGSAGGERSATRIAFVGRDDPRKGLDVLLAAWPAVRAAVPEAELLVIGAGREPLPGVRFAGRVSEAEKRTLLGSAGVFCAPNLGGESFGITVVEGMAAGCAVVASDLPAFHAVLGGAGVESPVGDTDALGEALGRVLTEAGLQERLQAAARARAARFDRDVVFAEYLDLYRQIAGR